MKIKFTIKNILYFLLIVTCLVFLYSKIKEDMKIAEKRRSLANVMGVSLDQYPLLPNDYFSEKLTEGVTLEEVHKIVLGYERVFNNPPHYEVYYYFSGDSDRADRIEITYDENFRVEKIMQEDDDSRTLTTVGWSEGLLTR